MYNIEQGLKNICRNIRLSLASVATVSACIFLFCVFFAIVANLNAAVETIETKVGITVFFNEDLSENAIKEIGLAISDRPEVKSMEYVSETDAWNSFKDEYFAGHEELAEGFAEDNPLKGSSNYTIFLNDIGTQEEFVDYLESIEGVRQVNYSSQAGSSLQSLNKMIGIISLAVVILLLAVGMFLISNTIGVSAAFRKEEIATMKLIGATNHMVRAPFVIEGITLGLIGAAIPLAIIYFLYNYAVEYMNTHFNVLTGIFEFMPIEDIFPVMCGIGLILGVGLSFIVSRITMHKYLKV